MAVVRVKQDVRSVVFGADGVPVTLTADVTFDSSDPTDAAIIKAHPWAFESEAEARQSRETPGRVVAVNVEEWVEQATAAPGEKRKMSAAPTSPRSADLDDIAAAERNNPEAFEDDEPEGHGPITSKGWGRAVVAGHAAPADESGASPDDKVSGKAADAKGDVPKSVAKTVSNATPKEVGKGR